MKNSKITNTSSREEVLEAVKDNGLMLQYASSELKSDCEVVLAALNADKAELLYASRELRSDQELIAIKSITSIL